MDRHFSRDSEYGYIIEKITKKKREGVKLHEEIIQFKETINDMKKQNEERMNILENENNLLKRNLEDTKKENKRLEKRIRLMEEKYNHYDYIKKRRSKK